MELWMAIIGGGVGAGIVSVIGAVLAAWQKRKYEKEDRADTVQSELKSVKRSIDTLSERIAQSEVLASRRDILRFDDELLSKVRHSKDYFRQILDDIDVYDKYCNEHPRFRNGYTTAAEKHIRETYERCLEENSFI